MLRRTAIGLFIAPVLILTGFLSASLAQEKIEGTVISTNLTACEIKPGGCEGTLVLEAKIAGKAERVSFKVPKGTLITKGQGYMLLPAIQGSTVAIVYDVKAGGEKVAKSITVKP
jgi:hypothetical protein